MISSRKTVLRFASGNLRRAQDEVAIEEPLEIRLDTKPLVVTMRTPGHDKELAAGFLHTEGLLRTRKDLKDIRPNPRNRTGNSLDVFLTGNQSFDLPRLTRRGYASSSCGLCGKESIAAVKRRLKPISSRLKVSPAVL